MKEKEFLEILEPITHKLFGIALRLLGNPEDANDTLQEVLLKLWKMRKNLKQDGNIEAYSLRMINNQCIDRLRKEKKINSYTFDESKNVKKYDSDNTDFEDKDMVEFIISEVNKLPFKQRISIDLHDFQGYSYKEISQITNMTVNAIRINISRARTCIIEKFDKEV